MFGKTFTADPITRRRLKNLGEEDKFYIRDNHEPIIDRETFEICKQIRLGRNRNRGDYKNGVPIVRKRNYSRKYDFSSMLRCGFCGEILSRRTWHSGSEYKKRVWQCVTSTKFGKANCSCSKAIEETAIEKAFVRSYQLLYSNDSSLMDEFLETAREALSVDDTSAGLRKTKENLDKLKHKKENLLNLKLNGLVGDDTFTEKNFHLSQRIDSLEKTLAHLNRKKSQREDVEKKIKKFKKTLENGEPLNEFSREIFEAVIDHVIVGGYDEAGNTLPDKLTFVYKIGHKSALSAKEFKEQRKNAAHYIDFDKTPFDGYMEILHFEMFEPHFLFIDREKAGRQKIMKYTYDVSVGIVS